METGSSLFVCAELTLKFCNVDFNIYSIVSDRPRVKESIIQELILKITYIVGIQKKRLNETVFLLIVPLKESDYDLNFKTC